MKKIWITIKFFSLKILKMWYHDDEESTIENSNKVDFD